MTARIHIKKISIILFSIILIACSSSDHKLETVLKQCGPNREEMERILRYYSPENDSLKLKAAIFLIENMPGHYTLDGSYIDNFKNELKEKYPDKSYAWHKAMETIPEKIELNDICNKAYDLEWLEGGYLIEHIELLEKKKEYLSMKTINKYSTKHTIPLYSSC